MIPSPTVPEIVVDLAAVRHNVRTLRSRVAPASMMTVVKADGYGHGMVEVARAALEAGADWLGVATAHEARALRRAGVEARLLCWLTMPAAEPALLAELVAADVDLTAYSVAELDAIAEIAADLAPRTARVQLKVDTGLHRGGASVHDWAQLVRAAREHEESGLLRVTGIWSHLAAAEDPDHPATEAQVRVFDKALEAAARAGLRPEVRHLANSAAALLHPQTRYDLVRCGIASYGIDPAPDVARDRVPGGKPALWPAMTVQAPLVMVKHLAPGDGVSYGHTWIADRSTTVGLVPIGYADGVPRHAGAGVGSDEAAAVWVDGALRPVLGRVCMDQFVVDLRGDEPPPGTAAVLFGTGVDGAPRALDWARVCGTIDYEIVTRIGGRLVRRHIDSVREVEA